VGCINAAPFHSSTPGPVACRPHGARHFHERPKDDVCNVEQQTGLAALPPKLTAGDCRTLLACEPDFAAKSGELSAMDLARRSRPTCCRWEIRFRPVRDGGDLCHAVRGVGERCCLRHSQADRNGKRGRNEYFVCQLGRLYRSFARSSPFIVRPRSRRSSLATTGVSTPRFCRLDQRPVLRHRLPAAR